MTFSFVRSALILRRSCFRTSRLSLCSCSSSLSVESFFLLTHKTFCSLSLTHMPNTYYTTVFFACFCICMFSCLSIFRVKFFFCLNYELQLIWLCMFSQGGPVEPEPFPGQDPSLLMDQKPPMFSQQQYGPPQPHMAQGGYPPLQDPAGYHSMAGPMGQRPGFSMIRVQPRPGQPNALRLQLQHRLQAQQVYTDCS